MGLIIKKIINTECLVGVWKFTESIDDLYSLINLKPDDLDFINKFKIDKRKSEWLCTRLLLKELINADTRIIYDEDGKPLLEDNSYNISITHSSNFASIILSKTRKVGIDIEPITDRIEKVVHKFLSTDEQNQIINNELRLFHLYLCWCAKESLYKAYSKDKLDFINNISIKPFIPDRSGGFNAELNINNVKSTCFLNYESIENNVLVWCEI